MSSTSSCQIKSAGIAGAFLILTGALFLGFWTQLFDFVLYKVIHEIIFHYHVGSLTRSKTSVNDDKLNFLKQQLVLSEDSYSNELWEVTPIPVYIEFYFWNWTNPEDIYNEDPSVRKPKLVEMGPYVFKYVSSCPD